MQGYPVGVGNSVTFGVVRDIPGTVADIEQARFEVIAVAESFLLRVAMDRQDVRPLHGISDDDGRRVHCLLACTADRAGD